MTPRFVDALWECALPRSDTAPEAVGAATFLCAIPRAQRLLP
jgi:hypothetical protein